MISYNQPGFAGYLLQRLVTVGGNGAWPVDYAHLGICALM